MRRRRHPRLQGLLAAGAILLTACDAAPRHPSAGSLSSSRTPRPAAATTGPATLPPYHATRTYREVAAPVAIRIPSLRVSSSLQRLSVAADGEIETPSRPMRAGWYARGPRPGEPGRAVILGHLDSRTGPAIFYRVPLLRTGAEIDIDRADGTRATFRVRGIVRAPKRSFPSDLVYGPTFAPSLALVTCGGSLDPATGHHRDNVIVVADPG